MNGQMNKKTSGGLVILRDLVTSANAATAKKTPSRIICAGFSGSLRVVVVNADSLPE